MLTLFTSSSGDHNVPSAMGETPVFAHTPLRATTEDSIEKYKKDLIGEHESNFIFTIYLSLRDGIPLSLNDINTSLEKCIEHSIPIDLSLLRKVISR